MAVLGGPGEFDVHALFPAVASQHYLDTACMGLIAEPVRRAVADFARTVNSGDPPRPATDASVDLFRTAAECRAQVAAFCQCSADEIALVESTTHGMRLAAATVPLSPGDNIVLGDLEFLGLVTAWLRRCRDTGVEIRKVLSRAGRLDPDSYAAVMDERTRAVVVSAVQEVNGYRADIEGLGELCRRHCVYLVVDGIQEAGALPLNLSSSPADFYFAGGHKWLGNPFGVGFLYVSAGVLPAITPPEYGYFALEEPEMGWGRYLEWPGRSPFDPFQFTAAARKLEIGGTGNYAGAKGLHTSLQLLSSIGPDWIGARVLGLTDRLARGLVGVGATLCPGVDIPPRSSIISFNLPGGIDRERQFVDELAAERVFVSLRYVSGVGGIRVAPHFYCCERDIDRLVELVRAAVR